MRDGSKRTASNISDRDTRRLRWLVIIFLAISAVSACRGLDAFYRQHDPDQGYTRTLTHTYRNITINGVGFRIPVAYFHPLSIPKNGSDQVDTLLEVLYPDVSNMTTTEEQLYKEGKGQTFGMLMIESFYVQGRPRKTLPQSMAAMSIMFDIKMPAADVYGLHDLQYPHPERGAHEIFYEGTREDPKTFIMCGTPDPESYPHCEMHFLYQDTTIDLTFNRKLWLAHWRTLKANAIARLDEFHNGYQVISAKQ
jgi:hypothetical protein